MDFDWADETLHAEYGRRWLKQLLQVRGRAEDEWRDVLDHCEQLVKRRVAAATEQDRLKIRQIADRLLEVAGA
jgi:hypothetical protein